MDATGSEQVNSALNQVLLKLNMTLTEDETAKMRKLIISHSEIMYCCCLYGARRGAAASHG